MNPIAFSIFGIDIRWYGILIAIGIMIGLLIARFNCKWRKVDYNILLNIVLISLPLGIWYYVKKKYKLN